MYVFLIVNLHLDNEYINELPDKSVKTFLLHQHEFALSSLRDIPYIKHWYKCISIKGEIMYNTVKPVLSGQSKIRPKIGFQGQLLLNAGQKYSKNAYCNTFDLH